MQFTCIYDNPVCQCKASLQRCAKDTQLMTYTGTIQSDMGANTPYAMQPHSPETSCKWRFPPDIGCVRRPSSVRLCLRPPAVEFTRLSCVWPAGGGCAPPVIPKKSGGSPPWLLGQRYASVTMLNDCALSEFNQSMLHLSYSSACGTCYFESLHCMSFWLPVHAHAHDVAENGNRSPKHKLVPDAKPITECCITESVSVSVSVPGVTHRLH
jgi:hypothetical protein